jgi:hypothetical protein
LAYPKKNYKRRENSGLAEKCDGPVLRNRVAEGIPHAGAS